jgi:hypothetical protein
MRRSHHFSVERFGALDGPVKVVGLEPERDTVAVRSRRGVANPAVVVLDVEPVQLQHERPVMEKALVLLAGVPALTPEQLLVEPTASGDVSD